MKRLTRDPEFSALEVLRFPLMILVVFIHTIPSELYTVRLNLTANNLYLLVSESISHYVGRTAVPCFFLFSGYFFFLKMKDYNLTSYLKQLSKRSKTLLLPYLAWNCLFIVAALLKNTLFLKLNIGEDEILRTINNTSIYQLLWAGPILFPLWYLRDLLCMVLLTPVFYIVFRYAKAWGLLPFALAYLLVWESGVPGLGAVSLLFFGIGAYMGLYKFDIVSTCSTLSSYLILPAIALLIAALAARSIHQTEYLIRAFVVLGVPLWISLGAYLIKCGKLSRHLLTLSQTVFFIYALHELYIINWLKGAFSRLPIDHIAAKWISYFSIPTICLLICLCMYRLLRNYFPGILAILSGGRVTHQIENRQ